MAVAPPSSSGTPQAEHRAGPGSARTEPRLAFRAALGRYKGTRLAAIRLAQGVPPGDERIRPAGTAEEITEHLDQPAAVEALAARLPVGSRLALSLFAVTEARSMSLAGLAHALGVLGVESTPALVRLLELGLLAIEPSAEIGPVDDFATALKRGSRAGLAFRVHPTVPHAVRTVRPEGGLRPASGPVGQIREADGLEPILRLGALWQRAAAEPFRRTQQGAFYKRDRERIVNDPVLAGPIADAMVPLPGLAMLWLELARQVGLLEPDEAGQRLRAAAPSFWSDNAVHLPQMIATGWLALRTWHEPRGAAVDWVVSNLAVPYLRPALLLWLAALDEGEWVALDDLASSLSSRYPEWDSLWFVDEDRQVNARGISDSPSRPSRRRAAGPGRSRPRNEPSPQGSGLLEAVLLGAAYPMGLVRAAEAREKGRRVVQLTPLGRYVLALGPTPPSRPAFEQFLFVQPNFEVIAYRQGLTPPLVGRLSRFVRWSQIGAALELKLTRESVLLGLDGGLTPESMLEILTRPSQKPVPPGVVDAVRTWASRRERVTYYAAATLMEFGSRAERDQALESWPDGDREPPAAVADKFLLVEDERAIPFDRFRLTGARDYRRPPEVCVTVESDGVSMTLDPARSDLLVAAELSRFADEPSPAGAAPPRFVVTAASLRRGLSRGLDRHQLAAWYARRTGGEIPPAVRLLLAPLEARVAPLKPRRRVVLVMPAAELLDGLLQHPATSPWLGDRLGPTAVVIPEQHLPALQGALKGLGIPLEAEEP
jgi:hypothetical protein